MRIDGCGAGLVVRDGGVRVEVVSGVAIPVRGVCTGVGAVAEPAKSLRVEEERDGAVWVSEAQLHGGAVGGESDEGGFGKSLLDLVERPVEIVRGDGLLV